jgi:hypothetical protein
LKARIESTASWTRFGQALENRTMISDSAPASAYNYMNFGSTPILFAPLANDPASVDQKNNTITVGINYRFFGF